MFDEVAPHLTRAALGFLLGLALGFIARRGRFCTLGAIEDAVYAADTRRLRAWVLAVAVAIAGTQLLAAATAFDVSQTIYVSPRLEWAGAVIGGMLFGVGMALVGTCGFGTLLRLGGGDLKALFAFLIIGVSAYMAMRGLTGMARVRWVDPLAFDLSPRKTQTLGELAGLARGGQNALAAVVAFGLAGIALAHPGFRRSPGPILTGCAIGALVVAAWWATGVAGQDAFDARRAESFTFVSPIGETLVYAMLASGTRLDFPVGSVFGVMTGAFIAAKLGREFRWEGPDDVREVKRHLLGAFLMGTGGVTALGCTIGQGVTGLSTLAFGSVLAVVSIFTGARMGLYWIVERPTK
jgi:uncharacterized membrane protein YedE/YeeE